VLVDKEGRKASEVAVGAPAVLELAGTGRTESWGRSSSIPAREPYFSASYGVRAAGHLRVWLAARTPSSAFKMQRIPELHFSATLDGEPEVKLALV
jgi:hypothetical protein